MNHDELKRQLQKTPGYPIGFDFDRLINDFESAHKEWIRQHNLNPIDLPIIATCEFNIGIFYRLEYGELKELFTYPMDFIELFYNSKPYIEAYDSDDSDPIKIVEDLQIVVKTLTRGQKIFFYDILIMAIENRYFFSMGFFDWKRAKNELLFEIDDAKQELIKKDLERKLNKKLETIPDTKNKIMYLNMKKESLPKLYKGSAVIVDSLLRDLEKTDDLKTDSELPVISSDQLDRINQKAVAFKYFLVQHKLWDRTEQKNWSVILNILLGKKAGPNIEKSKDYISQVFTDPNQMLRNKKFIDELIKIFNDYKLEDVANLLKDDFKDKLGK